MARSVEEGFQGMRSESGEAMVLDNNIFVERILPGSVLREMTVAEMDEYRRPFVEPGESRRPTLTWPRQIPLDGEPADVNEAVDKYSQWLAASSLPKLFVNADPGAILTARRVSFVEFGQTRRRLLSLARTLFKKIRQMRSLARSETGCSNF